MDFLTGGCALLFSFLATAIMSYIAMAMPIGPWIESTLVLLALLIFHFLVKKTVTQRTHAIGLVTVAGGIAGSVAIACAFSFPTLYFLNQSLFIEWLKNPFAFMGIMAGLVISAGGFGFLMAHMYEEQFLNDSNMSFPIGQLVAKTITAPQQIRKALELLGGMLSVIFFAGVQFFTQKIPQTLILIKQRTWGLITIPSIALNPELIPFLIAIGFVTGHVIALPLAVGIFSKIVLLEPFQKWFFPSVGSNNFMLAFVSGLVIQGALMSIVDIPTIIFATIKRLKHSRTHHSSAIAHLKNSLFTQEVLVLLSAIGVFLAFFKFFVFSQLYLLIFTALCTYQLLVIAGKLGIAPVGRFATFVLLPGLLLFGYNDVQITLVSAFVEIAGMVAVDCLFGRKMAQLTLLEHKKVVRYQWLGLLLSSVTIGIIFWLLIKHFGLGSATLNAQKAYVRALLVNSYTFHYGALILGIVFGFVLKFFKINATLVLGGLLMSTEYSVLLLLGGLLASLMRNKEAQYPFWSGIFAASSLCMIIKALVKM